MLEQKLQAETEVNRHNFISCGEGTKLPSGIMVSLSICYKLLIIVWVFVTNS
jgi:hypothetical protein